MNIVDSTVWIDFLRGTTTPETDWLQQHKRSAQVALTDLILAEVLQGTRGQREFTQTRQLLLSFPVFTCAGAAVAVASAYHYQFLRTRGITVRKTIDCLIATFCIEHGHALLHNDRDFDHFERELGLRVVKV